MSKRSDLDKSSILRCIENLDSDVDKAIEFMVYIKNDLTHLRGYIEKKDWLLRTPRKNKQPGVDK